MSSANYVRDAFRGFYETKFKNPDGLEDDILRDHIRCRITEDEFQSRIDFEYSDLMDSEIRLVTLYPGSWNQEIRCGISHANLRTMTDPFFAISYTWGDTTELLPICCDDRQIYVTGNLYSCLLRVRQPNEAKVLWIDALCINQAATKVALDERARQIRLMGQVYSRADLVVVDLGGCNNQKMTRLLSYFDAFRRESHETLLKAVEEKKVVNSLVDFVFPHEFWSLYGDFVRRPWFHRVWVIQEYALAKHLVMMVGNIIFRADHLDGIIMNVSMHIACAVWQTVSSHWTDKDKTSSISSQKYDLGLTLSSKTESHLLHMSAIRQGLENTPKKDLLTSLLTMAQTFEASDEHDHVYGIFGLLDSSFAKSFNVDYTESLPKLALRLARLLVENDLGVFCIARSGGLANQSISWLPPLTPDRIRTEGGLWSYGPAGARYADIFNACGSTNALICLTNIEHILSVKAYRLDTIASFAEPLELPHTTIQNPPDVQITRPFLRWIIDTHAWATLNFNDWQYVTLRDSFWRTLVCDTAQNLVIHGGASVSRLPADGMKQISISIALDRLTDLQHSIVLRLMQQILSSEQFRSYQVSVLATSDKHKLSRTAQGRMALISHLSHKDDEIWIISGMRVPYILRNTGDDSQTRKIVGPCYVHEMMDGQALSLPGWKESTVLLR